MCEFTTIGDYSRVAFRGWRARFDSRSLSSVILVAPRPSGWSCAAQFIPVRAIYGFDAMSCPPSPHIVVAFNTGSWTVSYKRQTIFDASGEASILLVAQSSFLITSPMSSGSIIPLIAGLYTIIDRIRAGLFIRFYTAGISKISLIKFGFWDKLLHLLQFWSSEYHFRCKSQKTHPSMPLTSRIFLRWGCRSCHLSWSWHSFDQMIELYDHFSDLIQITRYTYIGITF